MEGSTYRNIYTNRYHDTTKRFQGFVKLFMVWKGSVIKLIWHDLLVFILFYFTLSLLYRHVFIYHEPVAQYFEMICIYCERYIFFSNYIYMKFNLKISNTASVVSIHFTYFFWSAVAGLTRRQESAAEKLYANN